MFETGDELGLVLAGGYAISAHGLTSRPLNRDDAVGLKVGAMLDRGTHRDFIDVHAAHIRGGYSLHELERLGAGHLADFDLGDMADRLDSIGSLGDDRFLDYGVTDEEVTGIRRWASSWADDVRQRLTTEDAGPTDGADGPDWDSYLDG